MKTSARIGAKVGVKKKPAAPKRSRKDPGLVHGSMAVSVETVNARMKKVCRQCGELPEARRVCVKTGSGRYAKTMILCRTCGDRWLLARTNEYLRATAFLAFGEIPAGMRRTSLEVEGIRDE